MERWDYVYKNCKNGCIYKKDADETDSKYCFAVGRKIVECKEKSLNWVFKIYNRIADHVGNGFVSGTVNWVGCKNVTSYYVGVSILYTSIARPIGCPQNELYNVTAKVTYNPSGGPYKTCSPYICNMVNDPNCTGSTLPDLIVRNNTNGNGCEVVKYDPNN